MFNRIRNIRKRWFVVAASVALLSIGLIGGAVFAADAPAHRLAGALQHGFGQDDDRRGKGDGDGAAVMARVAEILDVEQSELEAAFKTALDEQAEAGFDGRIDALVADETLTQEQGDAAKTWFEERPELSGPLAVRLAGTSDSDKVDSWLTKLVENERLTQDEADALSAWHADRPRLSPRYETPPQRPPQGTSRWRPRRR